MHKKLESELVSLAHGILQLKNKEDVLVLKEKTGELYEKLSVLAFLDRFVEATPSASKSEILEKMKVAEEAEDSAIETPLEKNVEADVEEKEEVIEEVVVAIQQEIISEEKVPVEAATDKVEVVIEEAVVEDLFSIRKAEKIVVTSNKKTLEKELEGTISLDITTDLFENAVRVEAPKKSLNDVLIGNNLQIDLNDRIAFVKHLFDGSQGDFNRVVSQLNSFKSEKEAIKFVTKMVKLDYDWNGKEAYEERFITLISRKFA
jgi:hypothetical protein